MEMLKKVPMREVNRICRNATEKALHELVHSRTFIEYTSSRRIEQANLLKTYQRACVLLTSLLILSFGFYWYSCFFLTTTTTTNKLQTTSEEEPELIPVQVPVCNAEQDLPKITTPEAAVGEQNWSHFFWNLIEQHNKGMVHVVDQSPKMNATAAAVQQKGKIDRTPCWHLCITMAELLYDRCVLFIQQSYYSGYHLLDLTRQLPMTKTDDQNSKNYIQLQVKSEKQEI